MGKQASKWHITAKYYQWISSTNKCVGLPLTGNIILVVTQRRALMCSCHIVRRSFVNCTHTFVSCQRLSVTCLRCGCHCLLSHYEAVYGFESLHDRRTNRYMSLWPILYILLFVFISSMEITVRHVSVRLSFYLYK